MKSNGKAVYAVSWTSSNFASCCSWMESLRKFDGKMKILPPVAYEVLCKSSLGVLCVAIINYNTQTHTQTSAQHSGI